MKAKDARKTSVLRMVKSALMNKQIEKGSEPTDDEITKLLHTLVKQRRDSIEQYSKAGRNELVENETAEIQVIEEYLPRAASADEIEKAVAEAIAETGATSAKEMGAVMKAALAKLSNKSVDGKAVNEAVRKKLVNT
jgi:uncharacterized protein YqeY